MVDVKDLIYKTILSREFITSKELKDIIKPTSWHYGRVLVSELVKEGLIKRSYLDELRSIGVFYQDINKQRITSNDMLKEHKRVKSLYATTKKVKKPYNKISTKHDNFHITEIESDRALGCYFNMLGYFIKLLEDAGRTNEAKALMETKVYKMWADCQSYIHPTRLTNYL